MMLSSLFLLSSCFFDFNDQAKVKTSNLKLNISSITNNTDALGDYDCFGFFVSWADATTNTCVDETLARVASPNLLIGTVGTNGILQASVPTGLARKVEIVALKSLNGVCPNILEIQNLQKPVLVIGETIVDLFAAEQSVTVDVSLSNAKFISNCTGDGIAWQASTTPDPIDGPDVDPIDVPEDPIDEPVGDIVAPFISNVSFVTSAGSYPINSEIYFDVTFSEQILVTGNPKIKLNANISPISYAFYYSGTNTNTLRFKYIVASRDSAGKLDYINPTTDFELASGTIKDAAGNNANLLLPSGVNTLSKNDTVILKILDSALFITTWKTDNAGTSASNQITLPLVSGATYNFTVDWGDGSSNTINSWSQPEKTHTYSSAGTYTVTMLGTFGRLFFNNLGDKDKILDISQWGDNAWTSMEAAFYGCTNLQMSATDGPDLSAMTNMSLMFRGASVFNGDIGEWDVSNITNMTHMFLEAVAFNQDIGNWDVSHVTNMSYMFQHALSFNQNIGSWNVSSVTNFSNMFYSAIVFNQNIGLWDMSSATDIRNMFWNATVFNQNIGGWDVSNVTVMDAVFYNATSFNQDISGWNTVNVYSVNSMFYGATSFNQNIGGWNVDNINNMNWMFYGAASFNQDISLWNVSLVTNMTNMFYNATSFNQDLSSWNVSSVVLYTNFDTGASSWVLPKPAF